MIESNQFKTASLLVKLGNAVTYYRNQKMEDIDLTSVQSDVIIHTLRNPGITATQLKEYLQLSQSTVAGIIARLESKGLIEKIIDKDDARKSIINPTPQGKELESSLKNIAFDTQNCLIRGMNAEEQKEFDRLLSIALDNINSIRTSK